MATQQPPKKKVKTTLHSFFASTRNVPVEGLQQSPVTENQQSSPIESAQASPGEIHHVISCSEIERDPGKRKKICEWPICKRDEIRRKYLMVGPYQPKLGDYKPRVYTDKSRHFQYNWFDKFSWLEYSPTTHKAYCLPCFLFANVQRTHSLSALVTIGFDNWKNVTGKECVFRSHIGSSFSSAHNKCVASARALMRPAQHIDKVIHRTNKEEVIKNRLRLKTTIISVRWVVLQGCAFRGNDESESSLNRGNVIELIDAFGEISKDVGNVVLGNAPKNAKYSSPDIQKEILAIIADRVRRLIREEVGDACFSILVDEANDESNHEQMAIILRFVNVAGVLTERFFAIKGVSDTSSETLKNEIQNVLAHYNLQVYKIRGQGYDGASNMRGQWNGLQALFLRDCPYAYYMHCFAHRLQLTLVAAAKQCDPIWDFFSLLDNVINIVKSSPKRMTELQALHKIEIEKMLAAGERESGRGVNQMKNLQRSGSTRWSSHYHSVESMIEMYAATSKLLEKLKDHSNPKARAEIRGASKGIKSFDFVFGLLFMKLTMHITDFLSQAFQKEVVDILAAIGYVSNAEKFLKELRENGWESFIQSVNNFCTVHDIFVPDLKEKNGRGQSVTVEHHYRVEVFNVAIDFQVSELNSRFNETSVRLLTLSVALDPKNSFQSFNVNNICELAQKFYPGDFDNQEMNCLMAELQYYREDVLCDPIFQVHSLAKLCEKLVETGRSDDYKMITRLIRLVLTLPVSTATTERAFSAMKHVKTAVRSKMNNEFLGDCMTLFY